jgi:hypothetical protein
VRDKLADVLRKLMPGGSFFEGSHIFTPHADVPDDGALRLVVLPPDNFYTKQETRVASDEVMEFLRNHGPKPRYRGNRLIFIGPEHASLPRVRDCVRTALAWSSIVLDAIGKGTAKAAGNLATLHPGNAAADLGKGAGGTAKHVGVGTGKGAAKIGKGSAKGIGKLGKKIVGKGNKNKKEPDVAD